MPQVGNWNRRWALLLLIAFVFIMNLQMPGHSAADDSAPTPPDAASASDHAPSAISKSAMTTVQTGDNLRSIAKARYGHDRFDGLIALLNEITDVDKISVGMTLKTPPLLDALESSGLAPRYKPAIKALSESVDQFYIALPAYLVARKASVPAGRRFSTPDESRHALTECADLIDGAVQLLSEVDLGHKIPHSSIAQFSKSARQLRRLANGLRDGYGYDYELVGQRYAMGFTYLLKWARAGHQ